MSRVKFNPTDPAKPSLPTIDVSGITNKWLDVDYTPSNPHQARKLDVYLPEDGTEPFPALICMHGGAFWGGAKNDFQVAPFFEALDYGFAVISVEQRLCNQLPDGSFNSDGKFPNPVFDFKAAIRYLRANADKYKLNPERFAVAGGSAGGYHAIMAAATDGIDAMYDASLGFADISGKVRAVVDWYGVGDPVTQSISNDNSPDVTLLSGLNMKTSNYADIFLGVNARENTNLAYFANPETWITKDLPPTLIWHGTADIISTIECSRRLAAKIEQICGKDRVVYEEFEGYAHGDMRFSSPENFTRLIDWLNAQLL
jgi:acetyl esterase/lipase